MAATEETDPPTQKPSLATTVNEDRRETPLEAIAGMAFVLVIALFVMTFLFQNYKIPSGSMMGTLLIGDHVVVDRTTLAPPSPWMPLVHQREVRRGDIIVFFKPTPENLILVKRTIAIAGDHIHLRNGVVYLNGVPQNEPYAAMPNNNGTSNDAYQHARDDFPQDVQGIGEQAAANHAAVWAAELPSYIQGDDLVVPPGTVFAMGDNRMNSLDGRFWGFVPLKSIMGRPLFVYWSFQTPADQSEKQSATQRIGFFVHVILHIFDQTRWKRTLHLIR